MENIHFILNDQEISVTLPPGMLVLDFLRRHQKLVGTKEGCREGDCGACTVLLGERIDGKVRYRAHPSCLIPVGELAGKHLVTVEGLNTEHLNPVQQAIVEEGATQCGFCTPGIVVSLTGMLLQENVQIDLDTVKTWLSGHLCRCTGYRSLKAVTYYLKETLPSRIRPETLIEKGFLPAYFSEIPERLSRLPQNVKSQNGRKARIPIAGGTDIYIQQGERLPEAPVLVLNRYPELRGIRKIDGYLGVGALTTFEEFAQHPEIQKMIPRIADFMHLIASLQIRNRATIGGNIINASPIGDMTILLLALDAILVFKNGQKTRQVPLRSFYKGYKQFDKKPSEILMEVLIPELPLDARIHFEKVSKRETLDIASVNSAICIRCDVQGVIREAGISMGGVAPIPLFLRRTSAFLENKHLQTDIIEKALEFMQEEIQPIDDIRGSAAYKRLLARNLMIAHFTQLFPEKLTVREFYEAH